MVQKVSTTTDADENEECYICMQGGPCLIRPCVCNAYVHAECLVQAMKKQNVTICTICKKPFQVTTESYMRRFSCNIIMLTTTSFIIPIICLICILTSYASRDFDYYMTHYIAVWVIVFMAVAMMICVCVALWWLYCARVQRSCWCESRVVPRKRRVTLNDGTCVFLQERSTCYLPRCTNNEVIFQC